MLTLFHFLLYFIILYFTLLRCKTFLHYSPVCCVYTTKTLTSTWSEGGGLRAGQGGEQPRQGDASRVGRAHAESGRAGEGAQCGLVHAWRWRHCALQSLLMHRMQSAFSYMQSAACSQGGCRFPLPASRFAACIHAVFSSRVFTRRTTHHPRGCIRTWHYSHHLVLFASMILDYASANFKMYCLSLSSVDMDD